MTSKKRILPPRVSIYFSDEISSAENYKALRELSEKTGLSYSAIAYMAFSSGFPQVREGLMNLQPVKPRGRKSRAVN